MSHLYGGTKNAPAYVQPSWYPRQSGDKASKGETDKEKKPLPKTPETSQEADRRKAPQREKEGRGTENQTYYYPTPQQNPSSAQVPTSPRKVLFESDFSEHLFRLDGYSF